jgi:hypothetical protein
MSCQVDAVVPANVSSPTATHHSKHITRKPITDRDQFNLATILFRKVATISELAQSDFEGQLNSKVFGQLANWLLVESLFSSSSILNLLRCSYIEIYNKTISDLLSSNPQKLKVQELAEGHVVVHNLIETSVNTPDAVLKLMQQGIDKDHWLMLCYSFSPIPTDPEFLECL